MKVYLFLILYIALSMCNGLCQAKPWDFLVFTQEWPGTFCKYTKCNFPTDIVTGWNIHGLWPSNSHGKDPFNCDGAPPFNFDNLQVILSKLRVNWADLKNYINPEEFWKHEWSKHGTCAIEDPLMPNELGYFNSSLTLKSKMNIDQTLQANNIVPSDTNTYTESMIVDVIQKSLSITPLLRCIKYDDQLYLSAVEICTDKDFNLQNCATKSRTDEEISHEIVSDVFQNIRLSLTGRYSATPVNRPCQDEPFLIPLIATSK